VPYAPLVEFEGPLWVIRDRVGRPARPAISAMLPKAESNSEH